MENSSNWSLNTPLNYPTGDFWPYYPNIYPLVQTYYPMYYSYWSNESNIEKAFRITQKLIEKKIVNPIKIKDFIELVNEIASII